MTIRKLLRCWLAWLRCERGPAHPLPVVLALPSHEPIIAPVPLTVSLEALWERPAVTPDRTGYTGPAQASVADVSAWIYGDVGRGFMRTAPADVRDAAVSWLALRESVTGVRL